MGDKRNCIPVELVNIVFIRDKYTCHYCGKKGTLIRRYGKPCVVENPNNVNLEIIVRSYNGLDVIPFEIDHVFPLCDGGNNAPDNLVLSCFKCNRAKGKKHW
jgi:5-methylcytosine-specific restriction endonuclease McrA